MARSKHIRLVFHLDTDHRVRRAKFLVILIDELHHLGHGLGFPFHEFLVTWREIELLALPSLIRSRRFEFGVSLGVPDYILREMSLNGLSAHIAAEPQDFKFHVIFFAIIYEGPDGLVSIHIIVGLDIAPGHRDLDTGDVESGSQ